MIQGNPESNSTLPDPIPVPDAIGKPASRRAFLRRSLFALGGLGAMGAYPFAEPFWLRTRRITVPIPNLPDSFVGFRIAFLSDFHHGPLTGLGFIQSAVERAMSLSPDLIALTGDYVDTSPEFIAPCFEVLSGLKAPAGVFATLGNHDHWESEPATQDAIAKSGFTNLRNKGTWLEKGGDRLRMAGVGDLWEDQQDYAQALSDTRDDETSIVLSHNPDVAEHIEDPRVGLVLSGHTHGGQVCIPGYGAPRVPSYFGEKYRYGLVQSPKTQVYVTSGVGVVDHHIRFGCRPEIALITLAKEEPGGPPS